MIIYTLFYVFIKRLSSSAPQCRTVHHRVHHSIGRCCISMCVLSLGRAHAYSSDVSEYECKWASRFTRLLVDVCQAEAVVWVLPWQQRLSGDCAFVSVVMATDNCIIRDAERRTMLSNAAYRHETTISADLWPPVSVFPGLSEQLHIMNKQKK